MLLLHNDNEGSYRDTEWSIVRLPIILLTYYWCPNTHAHAHTHTHTQRKSERVRERRKDRHTNTHINTHIHTHGVFLYHAIRQNIIYSITLQRNEICLINSPLWKIYRQNRIEPGRFISGRHVEGDVLKA